MRLAVRLAKPQRIVEIVVWTLGPWIVRARREEVEQSSVRWRGRGSAIQATVSIAITIDFGIARCGDVEREEQVVYSDIGRIVSLDHMVQVADRLGCLVLGML